MTSSERKAVSQFPYPPRRYIHNCATDRPMPPPPPPTTGNYHMFGQQYNQDLPQAPPHLQQLPQAQQQQQLQQQQQVQQQSQSNQLVTLKKLNSLLLDLFIQLIQVLCETPNISNQQQQQSKHEVLIGKIEAVFSKMQMIINNLRPLQACIELKNLIDKQTNNRKNIIVKLNDTCDKAYNYIQVSVDHLIKPSMQISKEYIHAPIKLLLQDSAGSDQQQNASNEESNDDDDLLLLGTSENTSHGQQPTIYNDELMNQFLGIVNDQL